MIVATVRSNC